MVDGLEMQDLPPVPEIEVVLEPNQVPHQVGVVSSVSHLVACNLRASNVSHLLRREVITVVV